jgi:hypothetical protein
MTNLETLAFIAAQNLSNVNAESPLTPFETVKLVAGLALLGFGFLAWIKHLRNEANKPDSDDQFERHSKVENGATRVTNRTIAVEDPGRGRENEITNRTTTCEGMHRHLAYGGYQNIVRKVEVSVMDGHQVISCPALERQGGKDICANYPEQVMYAGTVYKNRSRTQECWRMKASKVKMVG